MSYKDYNGIIHKDGKVEIPEASRMQAQGLFDMLLQKGFFIQNITPLSEYNDVYAALKDNVTFFFETSLGHTWLVVNPVNNPLIIRDTKSKQVAINYSQSCS